MQTTILNRFKEFLMSACKTRAAVLILVGVAVVPLARAQNIRVDATPCHAANTIKPTEALGAGIDRLPYGAADKLFVDDTIKQILSAGWQTVTYRQNTELHMEAWHWNPQGTWSDPVVTSYAVLRPDGQWSLLVVNKDQENAHTVTIAFDDAEKKTSAMFAGPLSVTTFGKAQYAWHPNLNGGTADSDGPAAKSSVNAEPRTKFALPAASVTVLRGSVSAPKPGSK